jgi:hypothetical protein
MELSFFLRQLLAADMKSGRHFPALLKQLVKHVDGF